MNPLLAILMTVAEEENGQIKGRTLLQKKLYFLSTMMEEDFEYIPHYYGPYSGTVADAVDALVSAGFLKVETEVLPSLNIFGEVRRYSYTITEDGKMLLEQKSKSQDFQQWLGALRELNSCEMSQDFHILSLAAKMHYIVSEQGKATSDEIRKISRKLGWQISEKDIEKVANELECLSLIEMVDD